MKKFFYLLAVAATVTLTACAALRQTPTVWSSFAGAYRQSHCAEYAVAVTKTLRSREIEAYFVQYEWKTPALEHGCHAVCMFKQGDQWFMVDNEQALPMLVTGSLQERCQSFLLRRNFDLGIKVYNAMIRENYELRK